MPDIISLVEQKGLQLRRVSSSKGGEFACACPMCGGDERSDRFRVWPEQGDGGKWWCRQCDIGGDCIEFLRKACGLSFKEAAEVMGRKAPSRSAVRTPRAPQPPKAPEAAARAGTLPPQAWTDRARAVVDRAHQALLSSPEQLRWLAARGITKQSAVRFCLGWLSEDYVRPYPAWGLPAETWDNGQPKLLRVPTGLVIPWIDGGNVLRIRVRQPERDPKYLVTPGGAKDPQPLMVIDSLWSGPHRAVVLCEAELDAILLAQEVGDVVAVVSLGSAQTRPHDARSLEAIQGAAWVGLWLDRDEAGDKAVASWLQSHADTAQDIRPQGAGKMDPGECHAQGISIRDHVLRSVPPAWRPGPCRSVQPTRGGGVLQPESVERPAGPPECVVRFGRILQSTPIVCRVSESAMTIMAMRKRGDGQWEQDWSWEMAHWDLMREASRLFWYDNEVFRFVEAHPSAATGVHGKNYWAPLGARKGE